METKLTRIEDKLDKVSDRLASIDATLAAQHVSLDHHIKRTDLLEQQIEPIKRQVSMAHGALKLVGGIAVLAAIAEGAVAFLSLIGHK